MRVFIQLRNVEDSDLELGRAIYSIKNNNPVKIGEFAGWGRESVRLIQKTNHDYKKVCHQNWWVAKEIEA